MSQTTTARRRQPRTPDAVPRPTREQRVARGRAARAEVPRSSHAEFSPGPDRPDPVAMLESQDRSRVPELLPIRYGRMAVSPFAYFRGAALPMASDLAGTPRSGLVVQACGDAHLSNFGLFASPERRLVFDINDFDETLPGPWEWDVKRLATSMEIAGRNNGYPAKERRDIVLATVAAYRGAMRDFAARTALDVWYARADVTQVESVVAERLRGHGRGRQRLARGVAKARARDNVGALGRFCGVRDGRPRILAEPPLIVPVADLAADPTQADAIERQLRDLVRAYRASLEPERRVLLDQYELVDMARKVVGVGSVGTRSWMLLFLGDHERDPLFLQAKEAGPSVLAEFAGPSEYDNAGQRVVVGQRLMQTVSDIFLGWMRVRGIDGQTRDFYLRQLRDGKGSLEVEAHVPKVMRVYGQMCGWTLARAHARSGDRIAIAAYLGAGRAFDEAIREFSERYADQNERDHQALLDAIGSGRIAAESGL
ncbi:MAG TPA: DUF2252 domain-containing protein [Pseudonocardia sp.]|uniref:DUF2252 domain-containing protein n=1 Tax=Pseudonocardia sp. TaxID=60912 RepID=UPI002CA7BB0F|nr:DUF2252 domain-containing protein [Pseudonocardia sp.]HTF48694.1 DUF2252 domain-containing protein [Pseudonocardia sp.]